MASHTDTLTDTEGGSVPDTATTTMTVTRYQPMERKY